MKPYIRNPVQGLDAAGDFGGQAVGAGELDFVFAGAAVADDDEVDGAFAAALELGADGAQGPGVVGEDGEAAVDLVGDAVDGFGRE